MIMLTKEESIKLVNEFLQYFFDCSTEYEVILLLNNLIELSKNNVKVSKINWEKYLIAAKSKLTKEGSHSFNGIEDNKTISEEQAFDAMILLLEDIYEQTASDDIGSFLGNLLHEEYGATSDPAAWYNWERFLQKVVSEQQNTNNQ